VKSPSVDVVAQKLSIRNGGVESVETLPPEVERFDFQVNEKTVVGVTLEAFDGELSSAPAVLDFSIGDLESPISPVFDVPGFQILEIIDVPDPIVPE
jgi:hypothetical protein